MIRYDGKLLEPSQVIQVVVKESGKSCYRLTNEIGLTKNSLERWTKGESQPSVISFDEFLDSMGYDLRLVKRGKANGI